MAGFGQMVGGTIATTDAGLIASGGDGGECRGIERESGNITVILPRAGEASRAALPHPFAITELWITLPRRPSAGSAALRWLAR
jgi:hypothetical protein